MASETTEETRPPPSFKGRLQLESFMYNGSGLRRSPRLSGALSYSAPPTPSAAQPNLPSKRKEPPSRNSQDGASDGDGNGTSSSSSASNSQAKRKRVRQPSSYAPPSTYAHLPPLPDSLGPNLLVLFVGLNPGIETARSGHAYAHPTNLFWRLLYSSGVTPRLCSPTEDRQMPALYSLGLTNIVSRPSRNGAELSKQEMDAGVDILEKKTRIWRPEVVCIVGKSIWESIWRVKHGKAIKPAEFRYGWQDETENMGVVGPQGQKEEEKEEGVEYSPDWKGARVFVATSTSGLAATLKPKEKEAIWKELGDWVVKRRAERVAAADRS